MNVPLMFFEGTGKTPARIGMAHPSLCPYGAFESRDGAQILISIQNEREWADFATHFLGDAGLTSRAEFATNMARVANRPMVDAHIAGVFASRTRSECVAALGAANTAYGFINGVEGLASHKALRRVVVETERGPVAMAAPAARFSDGARALGPVPALGAHTAAVRREFLP